MPNRRNLNLGLLLAVSGSVALAGCGSEKPAAQTPATTTIPAPATTTANPSVASSAPADPSAASATSANPAAPSATVTANPAAPATGGNPAASPTATAASHSAQPAAGKIAATATNGKPLAAPVKPGDIRLASVGNVGKTTTIDPNVVPVPHVPSLPSVTKKGKVAPVPDGLGYMAAAPKSAQRPMITTVKGTTVSVAPAAPQARSSKAVVFNLKPDGTPESNLLSKHATTASVSKPGQTPVKTVKPHVVAVSESKPVLPPAETKKVQADVNNTAKLELPGETSGPAVDEVRAKIQAQYDKQNVAIAKEDDKGVMAIYDTDWGKVHINGRKSEMSRQEFYFKRIFARLKNLHATTTIRRISVDGNNAYVVARQHWAARAMSGKLNKEVWTYVDFIVKDEWEKQSDGEWLMIATTNLRRVKYAPDHQVTVNGRTIPEDAPDDEHPAPAPSDADIDAVE